MSATTTSSNTIVAFHCTVSLEEEISKFWVVENLPRKNFVSNSDQFCEELYLKSTSRNESGQYIVSLPFKEAFPRDLALAIHVLVLSLSS